MMDTMESGTGREFLEPRMEERVGREYQRVSRDKSGLERSQDQQHDENKRACADQGITLGEPYREVGSASASKFARKERLDFQRLLTDLENGTFGAQFLVLWESSRGSRMMSEWVKLLELCEKEGVKIFVTSHDRIYDPTVPRDRKSMLEDAVDSEYESGKTSLRASRDSSSRAIEGRPHGRPPFGYRRRYDPETGKLIDQVVHPAEAEIVKEIFARLEKAEPLLSIVRVFKERGYRNRSGKFMTAGQIRDIALNPTYAGIRMHLKGAGVRHRGFTPGAKRYKGQWEALVPRGVFMQVHQLLTDPKRRTRRPGKLKHLLSTIVPCDVCGETVRLRHMKRVNEVVPSYVCGPNGHVTISQVELDKYIKATVLDYLAKVEIYQLLAADIGAEEGELEDVQDKLKEQRAELAQMRVAAAEERLTFETVSVMEPNYIRRIKELEAREALLRTPPLLRGLIEPGPGVAARWEDTPLAAQREIMRVVLTPEFLGRPYVMQIPMKDRKTPVAAIDRVRWERVEKTDGDRSDS
jgi:site-specific DNA recombinase